MAADDTNPPTTANPFRSQQLANVAAALGRDSNPRQVGPYEILERIGEGGMGTVYRAEQHSPLHRVVALKIIKLGMDTAALLARFDAERETLSLLDHPNVARVLDAGTTEFGRPYFVLEYVDGKPITHFADEMRLTIPERLSLMKQVCDAVQYAHQKAVLHRDLKPSNILVASIGGKPVVKVIDFGVAKAVGGSNSAQYVTEIGQRVGTLEYMSPEQAAGEHDIDTRSDVYSLGVVLYELLSGSMPFDPSTLRNANHEEAFRIIREVDAPRPSIRFTRQADSTVDIAQRRGESPASLAQRLRVELDWIAAKALRKNRNERYASPKELAEDIDNYLNHRPLRAGPETAGYRVRKFVRRNRGPVIAAGLILLVGLGGISATAWQAIRATRAERTIRSEQQQTLAEKTRAEAEARRAEAANAATGTVKNFLADMLQSVDPNNARGQSVLVRDVLDRASAQIAGKVAGQPRIEAELRGTIGSTYMNLGLLAEADTHMARAAQIYEQLDGPDAKSTLRARLQHVMLRNLQDRLPEARELTTHVLQRSRTLYGADDALTRDAMNELASIMEAMGDLNEAERIYRDVMAAEARLGNTNTRSYFITVGNVGQLIRPLGRLDEAADLCLQAYEGVKSLDGEDDPIALQMLGNYADVLRLQGKLDEAERHMARYLQLALKVFGPDDPRSINAEQGLAIVLHTQGKAVEALPHFDNALAQMRHVMGNEHRETLFQIMTYASIRVAHDDLPGGSALFKEAYEGWVKTVGPDHPNSIVCLHGMGLIACMQSEWTVALEPAQRLYEQVVDLARVQLSPAKRARYLSLYGVVLTRLGRDAEAIDPLVTAYSALVTTDIRNKGNIGAYESVVNSLVDIETRRGDSAKADYWRGEMSRFNDIFPPSTQPAP